MRKVLAILLGVATTVVMLVTGPRQVRLNDAPTGNPQLTQFMKERAPRGANQVTGFVMAADQPVFAGLGADEHTEVEVGSVTKTFNAELLRQAIEKGSVRADTKVKDIVDAKGSPIGEATLEQLANHETGLPRNPGTDPLALFLERNPYAKVSRQKIFDMAFDAKLKNQGTKQYSNLGAALLGQLLAEKDGRSWPDMVQQDIFTPLGMTESYVATFGSTEGKPHGINSKGHEAANWEKDGYAPAGSVRSTPHDMAKFASHLRKVGIPSYAWQHREDGIWHNGGTGGYMTMFIFDTAGQKVAFVNNNTTARVNQLGKDMLTWNS